MDVDRAEVVDMGGVYGSLAYNFRPTIDSIACSFVVNCFGGLKMLGISFMTIYSVSPRNSIPKISSNGTIIPLWSKDTVSLLMMDNYLIKPYGTVVLAFPGADPVEKFTVTVQEDGKTLKYSAPNA